MPVAIDKHVTYGLKETRMRFLVDGFLHGTVFEDHRLEDCMDEQGRIQYYKFASKAGQDEVKKSEDEASEVSHVNATIAKGITTIVTSPVYMLSQQGMPLLTSLEKMRASIEKNEDALMKQGPTRVLIPVHHLREPSKNPFKWIINWFAKKISKVDGHVILYEMEIDKDGNTTEKLYDSKPQPGYLQRVFNSWFYKARDFFTKVLEYTGIQTSRISCGHLAFATMRARLQADIGEALIPSQIPMSEREHTEFIKAGCTRIDGTGEMVRNLKRVQSDTARAVQALGGAKRVDSYGCGGDFVNLGDDDGFEDAGAAVSVEMEQQPSEDGYVAAASPATMSL